MTLSFGTVRPADGTSPSVTTRNSDPTNPVAAPSQCLVRITDGGFVVFFFIPSSFLMQAHAPHHGHTSRSVTETESHRVLRLSPEGILEEWIAYIHRQIDEVMSGNTRITRIRTHLHLSIRKLVSRYSQPAPERERPDAGREDLRQYFRRRAFGDEAVDREPAALLA